MEIEVLINDLIERSRLAYMNNDDRTGELLEKAAEVIRLQRECIVSESNERWHRKIDEMGVADGNNT